MISNSYLNSMKDYLIYDTSFLEELDQLEDSDSLFLLRELNDKIENHVYTIVDNMESNGMYVLEANKTIVSNLMGTFGRVNVEYIDMNKWDIDKDELSKIIHVKEIR